MGFLGFMKFDKCLVQIFDCAYADEDSGSGIPVDDLKPSHSAVYTRIWAELYLLVIWNTPCILHRCWFPCSPHFLIDDRLGAGRAGVEAIAGSAQYKEGKPPEKR